MKKIFLLIAVVALTATACKKDFLERQPKTDIGIERYFNSEEDCNILNRFHLLDNDNSFVYSGFNYDKGTIVLKENKVKWYQTTNNIKWLQFNHCLIGKPEHIIIYKIDKKKLVNVRRSII